MRNSWLILAVFLLLFACDSKQVFDQYKVTSSEGWHKDSIMQFEINILDSVAQYDLFLTLRNDNSYPYQNIFLISDINFPNGKVITDTLEYAMARPDGSWLGTGFSDVKENKLWLKENVRFAEEGIYKINVQQAVRANGQVDGDEWLQGILDVGLRVEQVVEENE